MNKGSKVQCFVLAKEGNAEDILLYESKLHRADMIVIGAHSKKKGRKGIVGTTAQKVAHKATLPVFIVKNSVKNSYKNIIAPTDFERQSKLSVLFAKNLSNFIKSI